MPENDQVEDTTETQEVTEVETETPDPEADPEPSGDDLPDWAKEKLRKANSEAAKSRVEAKSLRQKLKEQEPLVTAAQEAERAKMSELDRANADNTALKQQLAQRDTELLQSRYHIPDEYLEFIGEGTFEEKEARAAKVGQMVQPKDSPEQRPPSERPVESLKPGASPSTPPVEDHSYPAAWGYTPPRG
ncbi:hypothetical protein A5731_00430 [Mycolicibacterium conceptionense]|uniref:hypothetical protein n=1 Tax=Mycolicibacterium conceptionense TaxID=451644 RepID=UPI0007E96F0E|nr:hypothetical protein [Mycolicibacterium conceptionense]OBB15469.1 hypothetical protein A5718_29820 [Mycolicibacterium conceptionense]OBF09211.1 hypothetical protein A5731_00430 [Mycolicibacterium conceptionense]